MDDMASALGSILNNPQAMQQIMSLAGQLGLGGTPPAPAAQPAPTAQPAAPFSVPAAQPAPTAQPAVPFSVPVAQPAPAAVPEAAPAAAPPFSIPAPAPASASAPVLGNLLGGLDLGTMTKLAQILGTMNTTDQNVELLLALKPHFGEKRRKKVDDAIRIMQLVKVLPLLKETGIFGNLFGGGDD